MDAPTLTATAAATISGVLLGEYQRRRLTTLTYRYPEETTQAWPEPSTRRWVPLALAGVLGALTLRYTATGEAVHLLHLYPLAITAPWLAAVDADVHRLPYRTTMLALLASILGVVATAALTRTWPLAAAAALGWALSYGLFWALNKVGRGALGYGDVRLAGLIGLTTTPLSASATWLAFLLTLTATGGRCTRPRQPGSRHAYGPWPPRLARRPLIPLPKTERKGPRA